MEDKVVLYNETSAEIECLLVEKITHAETEEEKERLKRIYLNWIDFKNQLVAVERGFMP
jgi:hypothetical protein